MSWFTSMFRERMYQLNRQEEVDRQLSKLPCHKEVSLYLLEQRKLNRKLTAEYENAPFYEIPGIISQQMKVTGNELANIEKILREGCACVTLNEIQKRSSLFVGENYVLDMTE